MPNWTTITKSSSLSTRRGSPDAINLRLIHRKQKQGKRYTYLLFTFGADVCRQLGWHRGDRLNLRIDRESRLINLNRDPLGTFFLRNTVPKERYNPANYYASSFQLNLDTLTDRDLASFFSSFFSTSFITTTYQRSSDGLTFSIAPINNGS